MLQIPEKGTCLLGHKLAGYECEKRDVSSVSVLRLRAILNGCGCTDKQALANASGVFIRSIHRIFRDKKLEDGTVVPEQVTMGVTMADRVLMAANYLGFPEYRLGVDIDVFPTATEHDALAMAVAENLDDDDRLTADQAQIEARIAELMALRAKALA